MKRLRELRMERGLSLAVVAEAAHTTTSELSKFERGERDPSVNVLANLASFYNVSMDYLTGRTNVRAINTDENVPFIATSLASGLQMLNPNDQLRVEGYVIALVEEAERNRKRRRRRRTKDETKTDDNTTIND